jgi:hypothetical protein
MDVLYSGKEVELARNAGSLLFGLKLDNNSHLGESHHAAESRTSFPAVLRIRIRDPVPC